eukprot:985322-Pelagomonas_calceolata.AAC.5
MEIGVPQITLLASSLEKGPQLHPATIFHSQNLWVVRNVDFVVKKSVHAAAALAGGPAVLDLSHVAIMALLRNEAPPKLRVNWTGHTPAAWEERLKASLSLCTSNPGT